MKTLSIVATAAAALALAAYGNDAAAGLKGSPADPVLVTGCITIAASGFYQLDNDIVVGAPLGAPCGDITVDNGVFEMFGFGITGAGGGGSGGRSRG